MTRIGCGVIIVIIRYLAAISDQALLLLVIAQYPISEREKREEGERLVINMRSASFVSPYKRYLQQEKWIVDPLLGRHCLKSINKMTFNWKVKIGSLLTAWHRYRVMDLPISIPRVSNTLSSQGPNYRLFICKIKRKWLEKENNYYGCSFDSIKTSPSSPYQRLLRSGQCFSPSFLYGSLEWAATRFLIQFGFMFSCFLTSSGRGNNIYATAGWSLY